VVSGRAQSPGALFETKLLRVEREPTTSTRQARIIFKDFENSNLELDPSPIPTTGTGSSRTQPDLNFDNPACAARVCG